VKSIRHLKAPLPLEPGDTLLYGPSDVFGLLTCLKTWSPACHVEIYAGNGMSYASRNGIGVNSYPLRLTQLIAIRRPEFPVDFTRGAHWFDRVARGQAYDWLGLLCFTLAVKQGDPNKMFCSEFWKRFYPCCGLHVIAPDWDADRTSPAQCLQTPALKTIWRKHD
jgi:hypothetical protein